MSHEEKKNTRTLMFFSSLVDSNSAKNNHIVHKCVFSVDFSNIYVIFTLDARLNYFFNFHYIILPVQILHPFRYTSELLGTQVNQFLVKGLLIFC